MTIKLLRSGDDALHIEATKLLNDFELSEHRSHQLLAEPTYFFVVALTDSGEIMGRIYGYVLPRFDETEVQLYEVDVLELHQREGAATAMMEFIKEFAGDRGYSLLWVLTEGDNTRARAFYDSAGFVLEGFPTAMYEFWL